MIWVRADRVSVALGKIVSVMCQVAPKQVGVGQGVPQSCCQATLTVGVTAGSTYRSTQKSVAACCPPLRKVIKISTGSFCSNGELGFSTKASITKSGHCGAVLWSNGRYTTWIDGSGVGGEISPVAVAVGYGVAVMVGRSVGDAVDVAVAVKVLVGVGVLVGEGVRVVVGVLVGDGVRVVVGVLVGEGVRVVVGVLVGDGVRVGVGVLVGDGVRVVVGGTLATASGPGWPTGVGVVTSLGRGTRRLLSPWQPLAARVHSTSATRWAESGDQIPLTGVRARFLSCRGIVGR